eukprot:364358-Chlamydomonas_euryale.AAC.23
MQGNIAPSIKSHRWKALDPSTAIAMAGYPERALGASPGWAISPPGVLPEPLPKTLPDGPYHPQRDGIEAQLHALPLCSSLD